MSVNDVAKLSNFQAIAKACAKLFHIHYDNLLKVRKFVVQ